MRRTTDVIGRLHAHLDAVPPDQTTDTQDDKIEYCLARYLIAYFSCISIKREWESEQYNVKPYLPTLILRAAQMFETSDETWVETYRKRYEEITGKPVENGITIHRHPHSLPLGLRFCKLAQKVMGSGLNFDILNADCAALQLHFDQFLQDIYLQFGLYHKIHQAQVLALKGKYSDITFSVFTEDSKVVLSFENGRAEVSFTLDDPEAALGANLRSCNVSLSHALSMIETVAAQYRLDSLQIETSESE